MTDPRAHLAAALCRAWIDGLHQKPALRPVTAPGQPVRLDDTGRPPFVPLQRSGGPR